MKVWVVEEGENFEGGVVHAICSSRESARRIAGEIFADWNWNGKQQTNADHWICGCCWLSVIEHEVVD